MANHRGDSRVDPEYAGGIQYPFCSVNTSEFLLEQLESVARERDVGDILFNCWCPLRLVLEKQETMDAWMVGWMGGCMKECEMSICSHTLHPIAADSEPVELLNSFDTVDVCHCVIPQSIRDMIVMEHLLELVKTASESRLSIAFITMEGSDDYH